MRRAGYYIALFLKLILVYLWIVLTAPVTAIGICRQLYRRHKADNIIFVNFRKP
jgi:multisubunit Na+/H+ antiporter MnhG subunit